MTSPTTEPKYKLGERVQPKLTREAGTVKGSYTAPVSIKPITIYIVQVDGRVEPNTFFEYDLEPCTEDISKLAKINEIIEAWHKMGLRPSISKIDNGYCRGVIDTLFGDYGNDQIDLWEKERLLKYIGSE